MRYIHELCLRRTRTESPQAGALWKCNQCGHKFNFNRLTIQQYLDSKVSSGILTIVFMLVVMFFLGFVADPILNLYTDPYETLVGHEDVWQPVAVVNTKQTVSGWGQHFLKGLVSMGLLSFLRTMVLNPFQWWNLRNSGFVTGRVSGRSNTGRDRAISISWVAVLMGLLSASYLFYKWVQIIIGKFLQRLGNNIVDTQLPGDDDDLKPPPGWKYQADTQEEILTEPTAEGKSEEVESESIPPSKQPEAGHTLPQRTPGSWESAGYSSALDDAQNQGWSFDRL
jgi:hypothetical protein